MIKQINDDFKGSYEITFDMKCPENDCAYEFNSEEFKHEEGLTPQHYKLTALSMRTYCLGSGKMALKVTSPAKFTVYGVYRNADMTEGRGPMLLDKCFDTLEKAAEYINTKSGVMGRRAKWSQMRYGDWEVKEIHVF